MQAVERKSTEISNDHLSSVIALAEELEMYSRNAIDEKLQKEVASLTNLLPLLAKVGDVILMSQARVVMSAFKADVPSLELTKIIIKRLHERLRARTSPYYSVVRDGYPAAKVIFGLGVLLYFVIPISLFVVSIFSKYEFVFGMKVTTIGLVSFFGALGSVVSIMVRLHQFTDAKSSDKSILFFTGLFKPIIGAAFALFIFCLASSGLLPITIDEQRAAYFFGAVSFVAGFSERFAQDVVVKAESAIVTNRNSTS